MRNWEPKTERIRRTFEGNQIIKAAPEAIFPLLCPVREFDWIPEWDCQIVYTDSGVAEPGCIFQTNRETEGGLDTWVVSKHEPNRHIAFVRINHLRAMQYDIRLDSSAGNSTLLVWTQVITALSEEGDQYVEELREEDFLAVIKMLERLLNEYLANTAMAEERN